MPSEAPDLVLVEGNVHLVDDAWTIADALAIRDGRVVAAGATSDLRAIAGPRTRVIGLGGRTVIPGLIDSHIHALRAGLTWSDELHWEGLGSLDEALATVRDRVASTERGGWIQVVGGWHVRQFREARLPTRDELTAIAPEHPVWVQHLYDRVVLNRAGITALGLEAETPDPPGGSIERDERTGEPTGIVTGFGAIAGLWNRIPKPGPDAQIAGTKAWFAELNRLGVTTINDAAGSGQNWPDSYAPIEAIHDSGEQTVRVRWWMQPHVPGEELALVRRFIDEVPRDAGDEWLRPLGIGELPIRSLFDGDGIAGPPIEFPGDALTEWAEMVAVVAASGWGLHVHACRDATVRQLLPPIEDIGPRVVPQRFYFDHLEDVSVETMRRIAAIGGGIAFQDRAAYWEVDAFDDLEQASAAPPLRTALELGLPIGGGTDATRAASYNPFVSLWWMVTGSSVSGGHSRAREQCLSREEALRAYTLGSAWFSHDETSLGSLRPGSIADLAVLSDDYFSVHADHIRNIESVLTIVGGTVVHAGKDFEGLT